MCSDLSHRIEKMNTSFSHMNDYPLKYDLGLYLISESIYYMTFYSISHYRLCELHFPWSIYLSNHHQSPNLLIVQELVYNPEEQSPLPLLKTPVTSLTPIRPMSSMKLYPPLKIKTIFQNDSILSTVLLELKKPLLGKHSALT